MDRGTAIVLALILAPFSLVLIIALLRGYTIHVTMDRENRDRKG